MKFCSGCSTEIDTKDGDNHCKDCKSKAKRQRARANKAAREDALRSLGLVKVRGAMGGTYWE